MTATVLTPAARELGRAEARRMLRHPAYPIGLLYPAALTATSVGEMRSIPAANLTFVLLMLALVLVYAPITLVVANRVAAGTRRPRVAAVLDCAPLADRQRTVAAVVGLLRGPVLVASAGIALLVVTGPATTSATPDPSDAVYERTALEYLQLPALVLGAGLLGIAVARWLPRPGVLPLVALVVWLGTIGMNDMTGSGRAHDRTWFELWPVWLSGTRGMLPRQPLGQEMWHLVYLLGLGTLAGVAALLRTDGPRRALWAAAAVAAGLTALAGWLQLGR